MGLADKATVVKALRDLGLLYQLKGENSFKTRAYDLAADRISGLGGELDALIENGGLEELPNIGASMAAKIKELVTTGKLGALETLKAEFPPTILELLTVPDLGPKKAKALFDTLGVGSLGELEAACREGKVRGLKGFGEKTEHKLLQGIELVKRSSANGRRLLAEVLPLAEEMKTYLAQAPGVQRASLGGSVRRMRETVADVDIIASAPQAAPVLQRLIAHPNVATVLGQGESKASIRLKGSDLQIDLRVLPDEDFSAALHHFTGSKAHHIRLRGMALEKGLKISEWGVYRGEVKLPIGEEADIYALLGMQYVPPELREDWGEIEAALTHSLPTDLVMRQDIIGNVHSHTTWSDGVDSLEAMALAAKKLGMTYFTVTEHSQTSSYAGGLTEDRLRQQWDEIDAVNEKVKGIRLLKGIETDILEDGSLDYPDAVLEKLDVVIGSIHQRYSQDEAKMTARVLRAFDNPHLMIWGHPTGRLLLKREPALMNMERILDKAAEKGITMEVNGCPERLDLKPEHVRSALKRGLKISISTDAHSTHELAWHLPLAVACAQKGWARQSDVVNTLNSDDFLKAIRRRE
ncbi:MAG: DNA polymerase/3'-5' exonuclease PolX [Myxococcaceae bacterium]|nr:DNA polymerase/3'-5' exonuclease PolX [Myxococcaceae bacterium]